MIEASTESPSKAWDQALAAKSYSSEILSESFTRLHEQKKYELVVEGLLSTIRNDHAQPWTYDVLALEMKLAGRPAAQLDRVLQSRIDFVPGDVQQMMVTSAMLSRFDALEPAMDMCRRAAMTDPELPEPWMMGRSIADRLGVAEHRVWARCGILTHIWIDDFQSLHQEARTTVQTLADEAEKQGDQPTASDFRERLAAAQSVDVRVILKWVGTADLDLLVTEPNGARCDFKNRLTKNGGRLIAEQSGNSKSSSEHAEEYVCHTALNGDYQVAVRFIVGKVVSGSAVVEIIENEHSPMETRTRKTVALMRDDVVIPLTIKGGRAR